MALDDKSANALLRSIQGDPYLSHDGKDEHLPYGDAYPTRWHVSVKKIDTLKSTLKSILDILAWEPSSQTDKLSHVVKEKLIKEKENTIKLVGLTCTEENPMPELEYEYLQHRWTNLILDAVQTCYRDNGRATDAFKLLFSSTDGNNAAPANEKNAHGYLMAHKALVEHPYKWHKDNVDHVNEIVNASDPILVGQAVTDAVTDAQKDTRAKALSQMSAKVAAVTAMLKEIQKVNSHTFLVLLTHVIPNARKDKSHVFNRLKEHRLQHIMRQNALPPSSRRDYGAEDAIAFLSETYVRSNANARHVAWSAIINHYRTPGQELYQWLTSFDALIRAYVSYGSQAQRRAGLSSTEQQECNSIIGKALSDNEMITLSSLDPSQYSHNALENGTYALDSLKLLIATNMAKFTRKFRYCPRTLKNLEHRCKRHNIPMPDLKKHDKHNNKRPHTKRPVYATQTQDKAKRSKKTMASKKSVQVAQKSAFTSQAVPFKANRPGYGRGQPVHLQARSGTWRSPPVIGKGKKGKGLGKGKAGKSKGKSKGHKGTNPHAHLKCDFCHKIGHIKKNCFKHQRLQNNSLYMQTKIQAEPRIQACLEILENATATHACPHCFQPDCDYNNCPSFPDDKWDDMQHAQSLFFNSHLYDDCLSAKQNPYPHDLFTRETYYVQHSCEGDGDGSYDHSANHSYDAWQASQNDTNQWDDTNGRSGKQLSSEHAEGVGDINDKDENSDKEEDSPQADYDGFQEDSDPPSETDSDQESQ